MGSAIRLGRIAGIPVQIHFSFLLALPLLAYLFAQQFVAAAQLVGIPQGRIGGDRYLWGLAVALALFASVLLHELAHSLYARRTGTRVSAITLLMIGGVSQIEDSPRRPRDEAIMALLGPLTSLAIPVLVNGSFAGMVSADDIGRVRPAARDRVLSELVRRVPPLRADAPAWEALQAMQQAEVPEMAVVSPEGLLLGTVSRADIERSLRLAELQRSTWEGRATLRKRMA